MWDPLVLPACYFNSELLLLCYFSSITICISSFQHDYSIDTLKEVLHELLKSENFTQVINNDLFFYVVLLHQVLSRLERGVIRSYTILNRLSRLQCF